MGFAVGATDLKPPNRDGAPAAPRVVHSVDDFIELLILRQKLAVALLDQFGRLGRKQLARRLSDDLGSQHADHLFRRPIDENVAQRARILGNDSLGYIFDNGHQELLGPLQNTLPPPLLGEILVGRNPPASGHRLF